EEMIFVEIRGLDCYLFNTIIPGIDKSLEYSKEIIRQPKFIVDDMLGKLAVRLRMLGFDTTYYHDTADSFLLRKAKEESRILLTRDSSLVKVRGANAFWVSSRKLKEQIREVIKRYQLKIIPQNMFSRCSVCNEPLVDMPKEKVKDKVPPVVFNLFQEFSYCPKCDKYYWKGTHYEKILDELSEFIK
ncbi:MAG: Mut7-C RNAse domain-containing protein, partial [Candidatus Margulisiibacteriota bacterium]